MNKSVKTIFFLLLTSSVYGISFATLAKDTRLADFEKLKKIVEKNIANFDDLDFNVFSNQKWDEFPRSHSQDFSQDRGRDQ